ncbi:hypothetical protein [Sphingobacterium griseoflavum]|uniref:Lanthionine synthetase C-like protein n=1 Tax=Sphingobacterium griseoflavum TaxID=1474952 RepID=A0ABQ3HT14_9SPHI|nr:hypothetical protein [Sphingobacterium griseoflavum]GHE31809.1 hypothetical protein GCM10017764_13690 [Sphingobacterium griseoflavum]
MNNYVSTFDMLYLFLLSDKENRNKAAIDNWAKEVVERERYDFEFGIIGLGWLIGYLIDINYMEGNADEILEHIDDLVYKFTIREVTQQDDNIDSLLYHITYYQHRLSSKSSIQSYRSFTHLECTKLLLGKLNHFLLNDRRLSPEGVSTQLKVILKYTYLVKVCLSESLVEEALYFAIERLITFFEQQQNLDAYLIDLAKLYIAVRQYENPYWESKIRQVFNRAIVANPNDDGWFEIARKDHWTRDCLLGRARRTRKSHHFIFECLSNIVVTN